MNKSLKSASEMAVTVVLGEMDLTLEQAKDKLITILESEEDVRHTHIDRIYKALGAFTSAHASELKKLNTDPDDFKQDVVSNIMRRQGLDKFDSAKLTKSFDSLIFNIAKRYMIDLHRKASAKSRVDAQGNINPFDSMDAPVGQRSKMADRDLTRGEVIPGVQQMTRGQLADALRSHREEKRKKQFRDEKDKEAQKKDDYISYLLQKKYGAAAA